MRPQFDELDAQILQARIAEWQRVEGPRVGDFVKLRDGSLRRFTHDWGADIQTTCGDSHPCAADQRYYFGGSFMEFSGSLDSAIPKHALHDTGETREGSAWFFHHDHRQAHNGVSVVVPCRVYEVQG